MSTLFLLFVLVPLVELTLLIHVGRVIGAEPTVLLVIVTGLVGATLARMQGLQALRQVERDLTRGRMPTGSLLQGLLVLVGAAFLLTPGILTDATGLLLMVPEIRRRLAPVLVRYLRRRLNVRTFHADFPPGWTGPGGPDSGGVREVEVRDVSEEVTADGPEEDRNPSRGESDRS